MLGDVSISQNSRRIFRRFASDGDLFDIKLVGGPHDVGQLVVRRQGVGRGVEGGAPRDCVVMRAEGRAGKGVGNWSSDHGGSGT